MLQALKLQRFKRSDGGATAVEFALIAPMLIFIFMAIIDVSMMFFAAVNLDGAAIDAARRIRTGQAQQSGNAVADFSGSLCTRLDSMFTCAALFYDARVVTSYSGITLGIEYDPITGEPIVYGFSSGGSGDIVVVRTMYNWSFFTPMIGTFFETTPGTNKRMLASTVVFQNEPYE